MRAPSAARANLARSLIGNLVLNQVSQVLPATRDSLRASNRAAASSSDLSLALSPLIKAPVLSQSPVSDPSNNAQGGA